MREIKFRGKDKNEKWRYGSYAKLKALRGVIYYPLYRRLQGGEFNAVGTDWCYVDEKTVGQFTGVCDMDGKEIYEGDVLVIEGIKTDRYSKVWWKDARFTFYVGLSPISAYSLENGRLKNFRVAGNIYDNPDLIKE